MCQGKEIVIKIKYNLILERVVRRSRCQPAEMVNKTLNVYLIFHVGCDPDSRVTCTLTMKLQQFFFSSWLFSLKYDVINADTQIVIFQGIVLNQRYSNYFLSINKLVIVLSVDANKNKRQKMKYMYFSQSLSHVQLFVTQWTAARQISLSITNSWILLKLISIESVIPSHPLSSPSPPALSLPQHQSLFQ